MANNPQALAGYQNDHDLLVELKTEMRLLREDIKEMKDGNALTLEDHERRIRFLERWVWLALGGFSLIEILFTAFSSNGFKL